MFEVMAVTYGARFADMWRGPDAAKVKAAWAQKLGQLAPAQIKRGLDSLDQCKFPPTLPEFVALCRQATPDAHLLKLPAPRPGKEERERMLAQLAEVKLKMGWTA